jgi:transcriptional regulator with XRE-family HTH domain
MSDSAVKPQSGKFPTMAASYPYRHFRNVGHCAYHPCMSNRITLSQGKRIRYARETANLDQQALAEELHIGRSTLSSWESDHNRRPVPYAHLRLIAEVTGFDIEFLAPRELIFVPDTATDTEAVTERYLQPRPYDLPLFAFPVAA